MPNLMLTRKIYCSRSFALDSAQMKSNFEIKGHFLLENGYFLLCDFGACRIKVEFKLKALDFWLSKMECRFIFFEWMYLGSYI